MLSFFEFGVRNSGSFKEANCFTLRQIQIEILRAINDDGEFVLDNAWGLIVEVTENFWTSL